MVNDFYYLNNVGWHSDVNRGASVFLYGFAVPINKQGKYRNASCIMILALCYVVLIVINLLLLLEELFGIVPATFRGT